MNHARIRSIAIAALLVAIVPVASDQAMDATCNATGSLTSGVTDPVNGDEAFFKQVNPGSNVMILLDNSGSMAAQPQCDYAGWGTFNCVTPSINVPAAPSSPQTAPTVYVNGTCSPATLDATYTVGTVTATPQLLWMENVTPQRTFADLGNGGAPTNDKRANPTMPMSEPIRSN